MVLLGIVLLILGLLGVARALLIPAGAVLIVAGLIFDLLHVVFHTRRTDLLMQRLPRRMAARRWWARRILRDYKYNRPPAHGGLIDHQRPEWQR